MIKVRASVVRRGDQLGFVNKSDPLPHDLPEEVVESLQPGELDVLCVMAGGGLRVTRLLVPAEFHARVADADEKAQYAQVIELVGGLVPTTHHLDVQVLAPLVRALARTGQELAAQEVFRLLLQDFTATRTKGVLALEAYGTLSEPNPDLGRELLERVWVISELRRLEKDLLPVDSVPLIARTIPLSVWSSAQLAEYGEHAASCILKRFPDVKPWCKEHFDAVAAELQARSDRPRAPTSMSVLERLSGAMEDWDRRGLLKNRSLPCAMPPGTSSLPCPDGVDIEEISELFGVKLPEALGRAWAESDDLLPGRPLRFHTSARSIALAAQALVTLFTGESPPSGLFPVLPFADGKAYRVYALDLRAPCTDADFPVVSFVQEYSSVAPLAVEGPLKVIAERTKEWLGKALAPKARKKTKRESVAPADEERIRSIQQLVAQKALTMREVAPAELIDEFEQRAGVTLPAGYREFLLRVGNGGAGPSEVGLKPLPPPDTIPGVALAYPLTTECDEPSREVRSRLRDGIIPLGMGQGSEYVLVVTGKARGQVWVQGEDRALPFSKPTFLAWYLGWLEQDDLLEEPL